MEVTTEPADSTNLPKNGKEISRHRRLESTDLGDYRTQLGRVSGRIDQISVYLEQSIRKRAATHHHAITLGYIDSLISASTQLRPWELSTTSTSGLWPASRYEGSIKRFFHPSRHTHAISIRTMKTGPANNIVMEATAGGSSYREVTPAMSSKQDAREDLPEGTVTKQIKAALIERPMEPSIIDSLAGPVQTYLSTGDPPERNDTKYGINVREQAIHSQMCIWDEFNEMLFLTGSLTSRSSTYNFLGEGDETDSEEYRQGPGGDTQIVRRLRIANTEACITSLMSQEVRTARVLERLY